MGMSMINAFDPAHISALGDAEAALVARRRAALGPAYRLFYEKPVHFVRGEGVFLYDQHGEAYLDCYNNVASVGHCHSQVVAAMARQAALLNTHTRYLSEDVVAYAERLLATMPSAIGHIMFTCTGSEANDLALRVARAQTGAEGVIVTRLAYHGVTESLAELSPSLGPGVPAGRRIRTIAPPDTYRRAGDIGEMFAADVRAAIADLAKAGMKPAALLVDTIFSSDGVFPYPEGFLARAVQAIRAAGGLFIADEVQAGFGRTGKGMWGFSRHHVIPDIITMGKPMGAGHPLAAMACKPEILEKFAGRARYFNTFGGNPVSVAVGQAVLDVMDQEDLIANAFRVGEILNQGIKDVQARDERIGDVRGAGLFLGVELVKPGASKEPDAALAHYCVNGLRERRILISAAGPSANILKIRPPLPFSPAHADQFLAGLEAVLHDISTRTS
jgi:4-aminobutyrate aminotransferase-like enzyme